MSEIERHNFDGHEFRIQWVGDDPWFLAEEVCAIIDSGSWSWTNVLDKDEWHVGHVDGDHGPEEVLLFSEAGLYSVLLRTPSPRARPFRRHVTHEILPSIRRAELAPATHSDLSTLDVLRAAIDQIGAAQQRAERAELEANRANARMDGIEGLHGWFSALAIASLRGWRTDHEWCKRLGVAASRIGRGAGMRPGKTQHSLFGQVNLWPTAIWDQAYSSMGTDR